MKPFIRAERRSVRVLLAPTDVPGLESLIRLVGTRPMIEIATEAADVRLVLEAIARHKPATLVLSAPVFADAVELATHVRAASPGTGIILYDLPADSPNMPAVSPVDAEEPFVGIEDRESLLEAIDDASSGEFMVSPRVARYIASTFSELFAKRVAERTPGTEPSDRELQVLRMIAGGLSNFEVAEALNVSQNTVRAHLRSVSRKLGAHSRSQAVNQALLAGLINTDIARRR